MIRIRFIAPILILLLAAPSAVMAMGSTPDPPGQASSGYGSTANYICNGGVEYRYGPWYDPWDGTWCWYYIPETLKNGSSAPAIIYLHGMTLQAPDIYMDHIRHLNRQGYIVFFPQINKGGISGMLTDTNQNKMISRTIESVNAAFSECQQRFGNIIQTDNVYLFGHSLGGLIAACWEGWGGGPEVKAKLLANPAIDMSSVPDFVSVVTLDYQTLTKASRCPVIMLTGNNDSIASPSSVITLYNELSNSSSRVLYQANTDEHGDPVLKADHMAPICDDGWMPSWMMDLLGGDGEVDATDYRYYWAAMDALLANRTTLTFDMGAWSDGKAVTAVTQLR